jgi:RNA polymerase sigma-70 factor (ECF subfamily)
LHPYGPFPSRETKAVTPMNEATESPSIDEAVLVVRAQADPTVFGILYETHYTPILSFLYRRTLRISTAEELTSNTFFKALRGLGDFTPRAGVRFRAWLYRIAVNELRMHWRSLRVHRTSSLRVDEADMPRVAFVWPEMESPEVAAQNRRRFEAIHTAIAGIDEPYQTALTLRHFEKLSHEEIATVLDKSVGAVKTLIHRGLAKFAAAYAQIDETL